MNPNTEDPTTNGPSSVARRSRHHGHGRNHVRKGSPSTGADGSSKGASTTTPGFVTTTQAREAHGVVGEARFQTRANSPHSL